MIWHAALENNRAYLLRTEITKSHLNNRICQHCGVKTSTVTPSFYYVFNISLSCNINKPSFIGNLWWDLSLAEGITRASATAKRNRDRAPDTVVSFAYCVIFISFWPTWIPLMVGSFCSALERSSIPITKSRPDKGQPCLTRLSRASLTRAIMQNATRGIIVSDVKPS